MVQEIISFVTSNQRKVDELNERLGEVSYVIKQLPAELVEKQSFDVREVAESKLDHAISLFPGKKLLVDDRGFFISTLKGFPGTFVKLMCSSLSAHDVLKLMEGKGDRKASFITVIGYFDGKRKHFFEETEEGVIADAVRGANLRGWNDLLCIYEHPNVPGKTLAQYSDTEWSNYLNVLEQRSAHRQLALHLNDGRA
ncbi:hypothetical protein L0Y34_01365 [Candidatus Parcubacteria bacterium]|nr:hypothetical protein [Candidatus Parcubacteria bacterium]